MATSMVSSEAKQPPNEIPVHLLMAAATSSYFPLSTGFALYSTYVCWRRRDYAFLAASLAYLLIGFLRNSFVASLAALLLAAIYYVAYSVRPRGVEWVIWFLAVSSATVSYFMAPYISLTAYARTFSSWFSGSSSGRGLDMVPIYFTLTITSLGSLYTLYLRSSSRVSGFEKYFRDNLGAPEALAFIVFMSAAAAYLALGRGEAADRLAELAYYFLLMTVGLEIYEAASHEDGGDGGR